MSENIVWRFYVQNYQPLWDFIDANVAEYIVRKDGRGGTPIGSDSKIWSVVLVFSTNAAYEKTKSWVEANQAELRYSENWDQIT
jgi:hypothetical protein